MTRPARAAHLLQRPAPARAARTQRVADKRDRRAAARRTGLPQQRRRVRALLRQAEHAAAGPRRAAVVAQVRGAGHGRGAAQLRVQRRQERRVELAVARVARQHQDLQPGPPCVRARATAPAALPRRLSCGRERASPAPRSKGETRKRESAEFVSEQGARAGPKALPAASMPIASVSLPATTMSRLHSAAGGNLRCALCAVLCLCGGPCANQLAALSALQDVQKGALTPTVCLPSQGTESTVLRRRRCVRCACLMGAQAWPSIGGQDVDEKSHQCRSDTLGPVKRHSLWCRLCKAAEHIQAGRRKVAAGRQCAFGRSGLAVTLALLGASESAAQRLTAPSASLQNAAPHP